ncbi:hypothetical protein N7540_008836 [Penicillium herquei]|nr:hypothetical protein N7540_008836 [Penicillium herquei]
MRFSVISVLSLVGAVMASAHASHDGHAAVAKRGGCVGSLLCCSGLTTPLDHIVDPILEDLGINASEIVGSIGILCDPIEGSHCTTAPQCCTEANLLGGLVALGCESI